MPEQQALALDKPAAPAVPAAPAAAPEAKPQSRRFELPPDEKPAAAPVAAPAAKPADGVTPDAKNTADQAPATAPEGEAPETPEQAEKRKSRRFERKLGSAYRREAEAKARADLLQQQLDTFKKSQVPAADPGLPKLEDFDDIEKFAAAREKFAADKALKDHQSKQRIEAQKASMTKLAETWQSKVAKADEVYDDFEEVVGEIKPMTAWSHAIMEADNGPDIAYYLGKNMKEAKAKGETPEIERIAALPHHAQFREIGKLEAKLLANPPNKPKAPSKAPAPTTPLEGKSPVVSDKPSEDDDIGQWIRKRQRQVYGKNR